MDVVGVAVVVGVGVAVVVGVGVAVAVVVVVAVWVVVVVAVGVAVGVAVAVAVAVIVAGVDPGRNGAIAWTVDGTLDHVADMPPFTGAPLGLHLADLLTRHRPHVAWVEKVGAMPRQGVSSTWKFAENYGVILGTLGALAIPVRHVTPAAWKRAARLPKDKTAARQRATELWPAHSLDFALVKHDGRAEAALIALHGHNQQEAQQ